MQTGQVREMLRMGLCVVAIPLLLLLVWGGGRRGV